MTITKISPDVVDFDSALVVSPTLTIGDATAEDTKIVFDGNAQDYYIGLDDSADDLIIGLGSTVGTTPAISVDEDQKVTLPKKFTVDGADGAIDNDYVAFFRNQEGTDDRNFGLYLVGGSTSSDVAFRIDNQRTGGGNAFHVNGDGNVGIGDASPSNALVINRASSAAAYAVVGNGGNVQSYIGVAGDNLPVLGSLTNHDLRLVTNAAEKMRIFADGSVGLGPNWNGTKDSSFKVMADQVGWASIYHNDGNGSNRYGIKIICGADNAAGTNYLMGFENGDGSANQGYITFSSGTVTYGPFTAHHPCVIPDADNDPDSSENAYPYGTLLETISLSYTQTEETDTERGIRYNVQKSSGAYSKKVLGAYGSSMNDAPHNPDNEHQALILGDGHILCNNEKGNISVGDGICTSSTAGIGMKADKMAMIIGIAQEDVTFSGSETKLVAVQYGLQQFTPWTD